MSEQSIKICLGLNDCGEDEENRTQASMEQCQSRIEWLERLLKVIFESPATVSIEYDRLDLSWQVSMQSPVRWSYRLHRHLMAYVEYYRALQQKEHAIVASMLERCAQCYKTPQMRLMEPGEIDIIAA